MPTNEERKETAKSLYELTKYGAAVPVWHAHLILGLIDDDNYVHGTVLTNDSIVRLAELINPEPERTCELVGYSNFLVECDVDTFKCSNCGIHWIIDDLKCGSTAPSYCPNCGAFIIGERPE